MVSKNWTDWYSGLRLSSSSDNKKGPIMDKPIWIGRRTHSRQEQEMSRFHTEETLRWLLPNDYVVNKYLCECE